MPLVNLKPVLREAKAKGYAVAAFNPVDYASMKAMVKAAEELNAPVIIQSSAKTIKYYGHKAIDRLDARDRRTTRRSRSCCTSTTAKTSR